MSENFICPPRVPLWQFRREINAILNGHLLLGNRPAPSQWSENRFLQNTVWAESFYQFAKPFRLERGSFRPCTFEQFELFSDREHKVDLMPLMVTIKIQCRTASLIGVGAHHLPQGERLKQRAQQTALA